MEVDITEFRVNMHLRAFLLNILSNTYYSESFHMWLGYIDHAMFGSDLDWSGLYDHSERKIIFNLRRLPILSGGNQKLIVYGLEVPTIRPTFFPSVVNDHVIQVR